MSLSYYVYQVLYIYFAGYSFGYSPFLMWTYFFSLICWFVQDQHLLYKYHCNESCIFLEHTIVKGKETSY